MYHLATLFPLVARMRRWPVSRDQVLLLMAAINEIFLGLDTYLAHTISGTIRPNEWIPIVFGPAAGVMLLIAGGMAMRRRSAATILASLVFIASIIVGGVGAFFHLQRAVLPHAPTGQQWNLDLFFWAPPVLGPLAFALVGLLGLSAAWVETVPDSGRLTLLGGWQLQLPYSKTRAYFYMIGMGILIALISSVLDHARTRFENPSLWIPIVIGVFSVVVAVLLGIIDQPTRLDLFVYFGAMVLLIGVGGLGALLHAQADLVGQLVVPERFLRGAPILAPMLFANMGMLGLMVLLDPTEQR